MKPQCGVHKILCMDTLVTRSAGFSAPWQCDHWSTQVNDCISHTRLATKVFHLVGVLRIHDREIMESVQQVIFTSFGNFRVSLTNTISLAHRRLPSNSKRGKCHLLQRGNLGLRHNQGRHRRPIPQVCFQVDTGPIAFGRGVPKAM